jgi:hypothetical protein
MQVSWCWGGEIQWAMMGWPCRYDRISHAYVIVMRKSFGKWIRGRTQVEGWG